MRRGPGVTSRAPASPCCPAQAVGSPVFWAPTQPRIAILPGPATTTKECSTRTSTRWCAAARRCTFLSSPSRGLAPITRRRWHDLAAAASDLSPSMPRKAHARRAIPMMSGRDAATPTPVGEIQASVVRDLRYDTLLARFFSLYYVVVPFAFVPSFLDHLLDERQPPIP